MCIDQGFPRTGNANFILVGPISKKTSKEGSSELETVSSSNFEYLHFFVTGQ